MTLLADIPEELISLIVSYLSSMSQSSLADFASVSRLYHQIATKELYRSPCLRTRRDLICFTDRLNSTTGRYVICLSFTNNNVASSLNHAILDSILKHCSSLEHLNLTECSYLSSNAYRTAQPLAIGTITQITLAECQRITSENTLRGIAHNCPSLRHLDLSGVKPHILTHDAFNLLANSCPKVETLLLNWCISWVNDRLLINEVVQFTKLKRFEIEACRGVTDYGILAVVNALPALEVVVLGGVLELTDRSILPLVERYPHLRILDLSACGNLTQAVVDTIESNLLELETLDLSLCSGIDGERAKASLRRVKNMIVDERDRLEQFEQ